MEKIQLTLLTCRYMIYINNYHIYARGLVEIISVEENLTEFEAEISILNLL